MTDPGPLERALARLTSALESASIPYMVIGGIAVLVHGVPRLTRDIDVTVLLSPEDVPRLLRALAPAFRPLVGDPRSFARETRVLPIADHDGTPADIIFAGLPFEEEAIHRARPELLGEVQVRVCRPEDLIIHKIVSERSKDREDVKGILDRSGSSMDLERLDRVVESLSVDMEHPGMLEFWRGLRRGES